MVSWAEVHLCKVSVLVNDCMMPADTGYYNGRLHHVNIIVIIASCFYGADAPCVGFVDPADTFMQRVVKGLLLFFFLKPFQDRTSL